LLAFKKRIPQFVKFPLWYLFKAPQRKLGWHTLLNDITGILLFLFYQLLAPFVKLKPISICVGIYNRSDMFLDYFIPSLLKVKHLQFVELSIFDCNSDDKDDLLLAIKKKYHGSLVFNSEPINFSRAKSFNKAVKQSKHQKIFICDADFSIPDNIVTLVNLYTLFNTIWFPIVFYLFKDKPAIVHTANGQWMQWGGKGLLACNKKEFIKIGMLNEDYTSWGFEDEDLWQRFHQKKYIIIRNKCTGLLHHWHPSKNPKYQ